jgi:arylsulfatase A-like enzyme
MWTNGRYEMANGTSEIVEHAKNPGIGDIDYNSSQTGIMLIDRAVRFIDDHLALNVANDEDRPFLVYFASQAIHVPHTPPNDFDGVDAELNEPVNGTTGGATSDFVYELDIQVGKLLEKLEDEGLVENTIIFFTSDNGALWPRICDHGDPEHDNNGPLRDYKASVYEGGHRVPFIIKWPGKIEPGQVSDEPVLAQDWVATMYEITHQDMQEDQAMDCTSLLPLITGERIDDSPLHPFLIYQAGFAYDGAIREGNWVLMVDRNNEATELYNLETDLAQEVNLIGEAEHGELIQRLKEKFLTYNDHVDKTLDPRTTEVFKRH